jgi:RimJ/RimL family protein N-acetyltransferase
VRPLALKDLSVIAGWFEQIRDLSLFDRRQPLPVSADTLKATWRGDIKGPEPRSNYWFVAEDTAGDVVVLSGLLEINYISGDAILPMFVAHHARQHGIGIKMGALMLDLAFDQLRLSRVSSYFRSDNRASRKMVKHWGFSQEGKFRKAWFVEGKHYDIIAIGILRNEWRSQRKKLQASLNNDYIVTLGYKDKAWSWPRLPRMNKQGNKKNYDNKTGMH